MELISQNERQQTCTNTTHTHLLSDEFYNNVIKVLPKSEGPITEAHFVYPQSLKNTARVQAFRNFLFSKIGDWKA